MAFTMKSAAWALALASPAMAQNSNPLNGFISQVASVASVLSTEVPAPTTTAASSSTTAPSSTSATPSATSSAAAAAPVSHGLSTAARDGIIAASVIAAVLLLLLLGLCLCLCLRRRRRRREGTRDAADAPLRQDDWHHHNNSHHGYAGASSADASRTEMAEVPRMSNSRVDVARMNDGREAPNLAQHPAFHGRESDPYSAAGVGPAAAGLGAAEAAAAAPPRRSMGERRISDHMPSRKPVGTPPAEKNHRRTPLMVDTAAAGAAGAAAGAAYAHHRDNSANRHSGATTNRGSNPFTTPKEERAEPTYGSPLASHPSNPLLMTGPTDTRRNSYPDTTVEQTGALGPADGKNGTLVKGGKRPPTPLGFDFGPSVTSPTTDTFPATAAAPASADYPRTSMDASQPLVSQPATVDPDFNAAAVPFIPVSKYNNSPRTSTSEPRATSTASDTGVSTPTAAQRRSLEGRDFHYIGYDQAAEPVPVLPARSPKRTSFSNTPPNNMSNLELTPAIGGGRSSKRASVGQSQSPGRDIFRDSSDYAYSAPPLAAITGGRGSGSPRGSPRMSGAMGAPLGYTRSHEPGVHETRVRSGSNGNPYDAGNPYSQPAQSGPYPAYGHSHENNNNNSFQQPYYNQQQHGDVYSDVPLQHPHPVYGPGHDENVASSVESWASARAVPPTPWEDNAIRRLSSSGKLGPRPRYGRESSSGSASSTSANKRDTVVGPGYAGAGVEQSRTPDRKSVRFSDGHNQDYDDMSYRGGAGMHDSTYGSAVGSGVGYGAGSGYDAGWGESNVEEPTFEKYGAQHSSGRRQQGRERSGSSGSGFDPRYGRWTNETFGDNFGHGDYSVGEAL